MKTHHLPHIDWLKPLMGRGCWRNVPQTPLLMRRLSLPSSAFLCALLPVLLVGCGSAPKKSEPPARPQATAPASNKFYLDDGPGQTSPPNLDTIADAVPRDEALHRYANRPYTVMGKTYVPNVAQEPFIQTGVASWYGKRYHGLKTSTGEIYDMFGMTAAHPTLPLPSYVRVTNPANNQSVVVRINDRGPFLSDRIIDLSYVAAMKLDIARKGSGLVRVERLFAGSNAPNTAPIAAPGPAIASETNTLPRSTGTQIASSPVQTEAGLIYLQLGAFSSQDNAENFRARIDNTLTGTHEPITIERRNELHRVRMGPYKSHIDAELASSSVRDIFNFTPIILKP